MKVVSNPEAYYRNFAKNYEESVVGWGYSIPAETVRATLRSYRPKTSADILDLGCGDGLVGVELKKQGFFNIKGVDLSEEMLAKAATRGCYVTVQKVDLLKKLPFEDETFDCLISVGVTTYLSMHRKNTDRKALLFLSITLCAFQILQSSLSGCASPNPAGWCPSATR